MDNRSNDGEILHMPKTCVGQSRGNPTQAEVAWLAGVFDGEGHTGVKVDLRTPNSRINFAFNIGNTSLALMEKACTVILKITGRKPAVRLAVHAGVRGHRMDCYMLELYRFADILKVAQAILPYSTAKADVLSLIAQFITVRKTNRHGSGVLYGEEELSLLRELERFRRLPYPEALRTRLGLVEAERPTPTREGEAPCA